MYGKDTVLVLSGNYSTGLGVIRSLGESGHPVELVSAVKRNGSSRIASSSRYVVAGEEIMAAPMQEDGGRRLLDTVCRYVPVSGKKLLLPVDDFTTSVIDGNREALADHFRMPYVEDGGSIARLMDKSLQNRLAEEAGFMVPEGWTVRLDGEIGIPEKIVYPCFVKPLKSVLGEKGEMAVIHSREDLIRHLRQLQSACRDREVLVQEYLAIDQELDICGVCLGDCVIIPAVLKKRRIACFERGVTMVGEMVPLGSYGDELQQKAFDLLGSLGYHGLFDMEINLAGGKIWFGEINFRSGGPGYAYTLAGANLPGILASEFLSGGHEQSDEKVSMLGETFVYEKVAWEDYIHGLMTKAELRDVIGSADHRLLDRPDDPVPGKIFSRRIRLSEKKHKLLNLLRIEKRS